MNEICSIIVLYNPDEAVLKNIKASILQSDHVILVDNGSEIIHLSKIFDFIRGNNKVSFISNNSNLGIAAALNIGIKKALAMGYRWVATFDQDSLMPDDFLNKMLESYYLFLDNQSVRIISPLYRDLTTDKIISAGSNSVYITENYLVPFKNIETTITSGNLIDTKIFNEIGYFNDELFIDMVDHDFCLRCINAGFTILETSRTFLNHNLGAPKEFKILDRKITTTNHSPVRRYYMMRNRVYLYKKHRNNLRWIYRDACIFFGKDIPKILLLEKNKIGKLTMLIKGFSDGIKGKMGKINV